MVNGFSDARPASAVLVETARFVGLPVRPKRESQPVNVRLRRVATRARVQAVTSAVANVRTGEDSLVSAN